MPLAIVFPGQGAAFPGMGRPWNDHPAWDLVTEAEAATGRPLAHLLLDASAEDLGTTDAGQLAVLLVSLMAHRAIAPILADEDVVAMAGHSLGQITTLFAAEAVTFDAGMRLATTRADACATSARRRPGRMAALMGATLEQARSAITGSGDVWIANDNAPGQIVLAGRPGPLDAAIERAKSLGVRRSQLLAVGHAFHTPLLADAVEAWTPTVTATPFHPPTVPIVANTDATVRSGSAGWRAELVTHLVTPVRWRDSQLALSALGATTLVEVGPGRVLTGLARRTLPDLDLVNVGTPDEAASFADHATARADDPQPTGAAR